VTGDRFEPPHAVRAETLAQRIDQSRAAFNVIVILRRPLKVTREGWS
jgi:hypothetical protein